MLNFYFWARNEPKPTLSLREFTVWVEEHYTVDYTCVTLTNKEDGSMLLPPNRPRMLLEPDLARTIETIERISKAQAADASRAASSSASEYIAEETLPDVHPPTQPDMPTHVAVVMSPTPCPVCTHFAVVIQERNCEGNVRHILRKACQDCGNGYEDASPSWEFISCKHSKQHRKQRSLVCT